MMNFLNMDGEEKAIDLAASSVGGSEMSTAISERKMHIWIQHKKRSNSKLMYSLSMGVVILVFLATWFVFESIVNNNYYFTTGIYKAAESIDFIFFGLSESVVSYLKKASQVYCVKENCITANQFNYLNQAYGADDIYKYMSNQQLKYSRQSADDLDKLQKDILFSNKLYGPEIFNWLKTSESDYNNRVAHSSYMQLQPQLMIPTMPFFQSVNSILARLTWLREQEVRTNHSLAEMEKSDLYIEYRNDMINSAFQLVMKRVINGYKSLISLLQSSSYSQYYKILLWVSGSILVTCYVMMLGSLWSIQKFLSSAIHGYSLLQKRDLSYEIDKLNYCVNFFEYCDPFEEKEAMAEAVTAFIHTSGKDRAKYYNETNVRKSKAITHPRKGNDNAGKNAVNEMRRNQASKFKSSKLYSGVKRAVTLGTLLIILVISTLALTVLVDGLIKDSRDLKLMVMGSSSIMLSMELDFASVLIFSPYCVQHIAPRWKDSIQLLLNYKTDQQSFVGFWNEWRIPLKNMLGANNTIENIVYGDICKEVISYNSLPSEWPICQNLNQKIATKGMVGYSYYESTFLESLYSRLDQLIQVSSPNPPKAIDTNTIKNIADIFYSEQAVQLRSGHSSIYSQVLKTMANYAKAVSSNKEKQIDTLLSTLRIVGLAIVFVPFILLIINTSKHIKRDYMTALYTFEIMSPDTVLSNQYLLTKFKRFFKTTSY
jgi:hypothetical protein